MSAVIAAGAAAWPALPTHARPEKSRVVMAVDGRSSLYYLPLTIADQLGYFRAEGIELELLELPGDARAMQAMSSGLAEVCSGAYEQTLTLQAKNQMFESIVLQGRAPQIAFGVSTKALPGYRSTAELRGKKVGVSSIGSPSHLMAARVLALEGIRADDVEFVPVGMSTGAVIALRSGQVDAMSNIEPVMTMVEQKGDIKIIGDTRTLKGTTALFNGPMPAACLYTAVEFAQKNPNVCQGLVNGMVRGLKWLQTAGPGDIIKTVPESYLMNDRGLYLASFAKVRDSLSPDGVMPDDGPRTALKAVTDFDAGIKEAKIRLSKTFTNDFALKAKERFKA